jgi:hypothetical protein
VTLTKGKMEEREQEGLPTDTHALRIHKDRAARAELAAAVDSGDPDRIAAATAAVEACYEQLTIQALEPGAMENLLARHKPPQDQEARGALYNTATFPAALITACVLDSEITEDQWVEYTTKGPLSPGEAIALFNKCWDVNYRGPDPWFPKGSTGTRNYS